MSLAADTSASIEALQIAAWREMTPAAKLRIVTELIRASEDLARAGVRMRHPNAGEREVELRVAALRVDRAMMVRWLDWDSAREGY